ncbi:MAG: oligosaccharide flippase family protein [Pseudomonadota bacterium]
MLQTLKNILSNPTSLREQAMNASLWTLLSSSIRHPLRLASNLVLVRLLAPEAFGLMATVTVLQAGLNLFSDVGISQSVMRSEKGEDPRFLRIVWTVQILRGVVLSAIMILIALLVGAFGARWAGPDTVYADPRLPDLLLASVIVILSRGFESAANLLARRRMKLGRYTTIRTLCQLGGILTMVGMAFVIESVWALMAGSIMSGLLTLIVSHTLMPGPRMRIVWDSAEAGELWSFGKWLILSSIGGFFAFQGDRLVLGTLIDKELLGIYTIAVVWVRVGFEALRSVGVAVFIPSFAKIMRDRPGQIQRVLNRSFRAFAGLSGVIFLGLFLLGGWLIDTLYPAIYAPAKDLVPLLALRVLYLPFLVIQQFLIAQGLSRDTAFMQLTRGLVTLSATYFGYVHFGMEAAVAGFALAPVSSALMMIAHREVRGRMAAWQLLLVALIPFAICLGYVRFIA